LDCFDIVHFWRLVDVQVKMVNLTGTSVHHEYDLPQEIGVFPPKIGLTAPMPWDGIVFMMNTRCDYILKLVP